MLKFKYYFVTPFILLIISKLNAHQTDTSTLTVLRDTVYIACGGDTLGGILFYTPHVKENTPACLMLQGGGQVNLGNYILEAEYLAKQGIITLLCDKSGVGLSKGNGTWYNQTFQQKTSEYLCLFQWLKAHPKTNAQKIGVHGLSEGGRLLVAMMIADSSIAFGINVSGPIQSFKENQLYAIKQLLISRSFADTLVTETLQLWHRYFVAIAKRSIPEKLVKDIKQLHAIEPGLYLPSQLDTLPTRPQPQDIYYDNAAELKHVNIPLLVQYGSADKRVDVRKDSLHLKQAENAFIRLLWYKGVDHNMTNSQGEVYKDYLIDKLKFLQSIGIINI